MCGIVGYVGPQEAADIVLEGLKRLEYRGYDSSGIATIANGEFHIVRRKGKLGELVKLVQAHPLLGKTGIGHTRWATHGKPSDENAHPHRVDDIVLVHNGIIENYLDLRRTLQAQGRKFESETDTEILGHLIALSTQASLEERVRDALSQVHGAYAIVVLSLREPDTLVAAKNASPLVIGVHDQAGFVASDIPALLPYTRQVLVLNEGEMAIVKPGSVVIKTLEGRLVERAPKTIDWSPVMAEKEGHKHFMHKEIFEQPRAIGDTLRGRLGSNGMVQLEPEIQKILTGAERLVFTACGTSFHACVVGRMLFEELARVGCEVELASELRYRNPLLGPKTLVVCVSQSGETADTLAAIKEARKLGSPVLAIVNVLDSSISREATQTFYTHAGPEIGVASTKAFVTQVAAMNLLAVGTAVIRKQMTEQRAVELTEGLRQVPLLIETILQTENRILEVAQKIKGARSALYLGRAYGFPVALEGALKLKEISYIHAEGYAAGELKHGPIALIEPGVPIVAVATDGPLYEKIFSNLQEVRAREGFVVAIATEGDPRIDEVADEVLYVPRIDPVLAPLLTTVPMQLLAYHVAELRGTDVDQPRNLAKSVTVE
jgi:glutamine---fructose-6-phosphate transaminase (isomerizing)